MNNVAKSEMELLDNKQFGREEFLNYMRIFLPVEDSNSSCTSPSSLDAQRPIEQQAVIQLVSLKERTDDMFDMLRVEPWCLL